MAWEEKGRSESARMSTSEAKRRKGEREGERKEEIRGKRKNTHLDDLLLLLVILDHGHGGGDKGFCGRGGSERDR